jgi:hypothetical protein
LLADDDENKRSERGEFFLSIFYYCWRKEKNKIAKIQRKRSVREYDEHE